MGNLIEDAIRDARDLRTMALAGGLMIAVFFVAILAGMAWPASEENLRTGRLLFQRGAAFVIVGLALWFAYAGFDDLSHMPFSGGSGVFQSLGNGGTASTGDLVK